MDIVPDSNSGTAHDKLHWNCCWKQMGGKALWLAALLSFLGGIAALWRGGEFAGVSYMTWYWTALVGGVLALGVRGHHRCPHCRGPEGK